MSNFISKENFNWQKYVNRYKDLRTIDNIDVAWDHWCEEGKKQGRKFYTLAPYKNNKYYIITREYIKQKKNKLKNSSSVVISGLDDDIVINDYVSNIKKKLKKLNKNKLFVCQTVNENIDSVKNKFNKKNDVLNKEIKKEVLNKEIKKEVLKKEIKKEVLNKEVLNKEVNKDIEILEKETKYTDYKTIRKEIKDEWTNRTENSDIFFIDLEKNKSSSDESEKYFSRKNPINIYSNSS